MMRDPGPAAGKRILFWDEQAGALQPLLDALGVFSSRFKRGQPQDHVRSDVPWADREELSRALQLQSSMNPMGGEVLQSFMGWADCRICGARLGTRDLFGHGFVWPELADHYVIIHKVWTPECDGLLTAVRQARRARGGRP